MSTPEIGAVARYIRKLKPVTLTRDTRVTNHSFVDGRAVGFQAILQAGTAVLVDENGEPVARCRCGNPLLEPVFIKTAKCHGCPPNYKPPKGCAYGSDELRTRLYPNPPKVKGGYKRRRASRARPRPRTPGPRSRHRRALHRHLHPQCVRIQAERDPVGETHPARRRQRELQHHHERLGQRLVHVPAGGGRHRRHLHRGGERSGVGRPRHGEHDREGRRAHSRRRTRTSRQEQAPDPNYDCPDQPPASPGEDYLRNCPANP